MSKKRFVHMGCPVARALDEIGDWWTLLVIREAFYGVDTFSQFQKKLGVAKNVLTQRLDLLVEQKVMQRVRKRPEVDRATYQLTDKGHALLPVVIALMQWGNAWIFGEGHETLKVLDANDRQPIAQIKVRAHDGRVLSIADLRFRAGPGVAAVS
jgi:DNA-binding HxlR family transcriptional regulator